MTDSLFNDDEPGDDPPAINQSTAASASGRTSAPEKSSGQSQSLYRKYRPGSFATDELFGQDHVVNTLRNAIRLDRIAHAYLFCGPRGTGKTTTARILAKAVNCLDPDPGRRPCNVCDACRAINANATTDVIEIDAASNRGIDDIRDLRERVKYAPTSLKTKFYIIDEAHQITGAAANAFLKTLEEPPAHTRFVLATTDPEELLQTIVSRCQRFDFRRISLNAMTACLTKVAKAEHIDIEDAAITTIARHATGSLRDALGLLDQVAVYREDENAESSSITLELVRTVLGVSRNDRVEGIVRAIAAKNPGDGLTLVNEAMEAGEDIRQLGRQLVEYLRMLMLERASGSPDADDTARELAALFDLPHLATIAQVFADIDYRSRHASILQLPLELAVIQACTLERQAARPSNTDTATQLRGAATDNTNVAQGRSAPARKGPSLRDRVHGASIGKPQPPTTATPDVIRDATAEATDTQVAQKQNTHTRDPSPAISEPEMAESATSPIAPNNDDASADDDLGRIVELWNDIRMDVKAMNRRTEALLQQADPIQLDGSNLTLVAAYPFHQKRLNDDDTRKVIEAVIERHLGRPLIVSCISRDDARAVRARQTTAGSAPAGSNRRPEARDANSRESSASPQMQAKGEDEEPAEPSHSADNTSAEAEHLRDEIRSTPSSVSTPKLDDERVKAAMNIFDADIVDAER